MIGSYQMPLDSEIIVDNFAGGGGASLGIEMALGRPVTIAINHDAEAIAMHKANHPYTEHYQENIWDVKPRDIVKGRPVGLAWFSPDCKHFSKAKGGKPVNKAIRGLAWVALRWASLPEGKGKPRVIVLENVEEFITWGPIVDDRPCPKGKGKTFRAFINALKRHGYVVEWRELRACDYGAPTIRKRFFLIARCDGAPIIWPAATHGPNLLPYRTAAECIDWSIECPSIFGRKKSLAENTLRRIARGIKRFVIDAKKPFMVHVAHGDVGPNSKRWGKGERAVDEPLPTITTKGDLALISPILVGAGGPARAGEPRGLEKPFNTLLTRNHQYLCSAFIAKHFGGVTGVPIDTPFPTITQRGTQNQIVTSHMVKMRGENIGHPVDEPLHTISAQGTHFAQCQAFMVKYYGQGIGAELTEPMHTIMGKDKLGLVMIHGEAYQIVDIGLRMLTPRELYTAQGFPLSYKIVIEYKGKPLSKTAQVKMCGNSVSPLIAKAIVAANMTGSRLLETKQIERKIA